MGYWINIYKVNRELPEQLIYESLECDCIWNITPGIYRKSNTERVDYSTIAELLDAVEDTEEKKLRLEKSDILEVLTDEEMPVKEDECNFYIMTGLGIKNIALEKDKVFIEMQLQEIYDMLD